uniref:Putative secreted peptide n=1 Tax=Anopheles braziliensis TaxID=58242 RepID=A0A2M3ZP02_9DIPT
MCVLCLLFVCFARTNPPFVLGESIDTCVHILLRIALLPLFSGLSQTFSSSSSSCTSVCLVCSNQWYAYDVDQSMRMQSHFAFRLPSSSFSSTLVNVNHGPGIASKPFCKSYEIRVAHAL